MLIYFRDIRDLQELSYNINNLIAVQPWEVEPDVDTANTGNQYQIIMT